jgi:pterin-4a-carbinolamine dehydratase
MPHLVWQHLLRDDPGKNHDTFPPNFINTITVTNSICKEASTFFAGPDLALKYKFLLYRVHSMDAWTRFQDTLFLRMRDVKMSR